MVQEEISIDSTYSSGDFRRRFLGNIRKVFKADPVKDLLIAINAFGLAPPAGRLLQRPDGEWIGTDKSPSIMIRNAPGGKQKLLGHPAISIIYVDDQLSHPRNDT